MSDTLISKEIRHRLKAALSAAQIEVVTAAGLAPVTVLDRPPAGWVVPEASLPAIYALTVGERRDHEGLAEVGHVLQIDVVLMAREGGDPADQLDDMQLAVERIVTDAAGFGLARSFRLMSCEISQNQGALMIGARLMSFEIGFGSTPGDPSL